MSRNMRTQKNTSISQQPLQDTVYACHYILMGSAQTSAKGQTHILNVSVMGITLHSLGHSLFSNWIQRYPHSKCFWKPTEEGMFLPTYNVAYNGAYNVGRVKEKYKHLALKYKLWNSACHYMKQGDADTDTEISASHWTAVIRTVN